MRKIEILQSFERLKILADPRRLEILQLLMAKPATLTQLSRRLGGSPAWVRHHVKTLEGAHLVELGETRVVGRSVEKYYRDIAIAKLVMGGSHIGYFAACKQFFDLDYSSFGPGKLQDPTKG